jgi:hypothetical protein
MKSSLMIGTLHPNVTRVIKSRKMRLRGHAAINGGGGGEVHTTLWWGKPRERGHLEDLGIGGRIITKCI